MEGGAATIIPLATTSVAPGFGPTWILGYGAYLVVPLTANVCDSPRGHDHIRAKAVARGSTGQYMPMPSSTLLWPS